MPPAAPVTTQTLSFTFIRLSSCSSGPRASRAPHDHERAGTRAVRKTLTPALLDQLHVLGLGRLARRRLVAVIAQCAVGDLIHRVLLQAHGAKAFGNAETLVQRRDGIGHALSVALARRQPHDLR